MFSSVLVRNFPRQVLLLAGVLLIRFGVTSSTTDGRSVRGMSLCGVHMLMAATPFIPGFSMASAAKVILGIAGPSHPFASRLARRTLRGAVIDTASDDEVSDDGDDAAVVAAADLEDIIVVVTPGPSRNCLSW